MGPWSRETVCHSGEGVVGRTAPLCGGCLLILGWMGSPSVSPPQGYYQTHPKVGPTAACSVRSCQADNSITHHTYFPVRLWLDWNPKGTFYSKVIYGSQMLEINKYPSIGDGLAKCMYPYDGAFTHKKRAK